MASSRNLNPAAGVFNSASEQLDDPFGASSPSAEVKSTASAPSLASRPVSAGSTPTRVTQSLNTTPENTTRGSRASLSQGLSLVSPSRGSPEASSPGTSYGNASSPSPIREDRVGQEINDENAQGYYGTSFSVFFGNLPRAMSNDVLQTRLKILLEALVGKCYVTIARDKDDIPIAFASFTNAVHARQALTLGTKCVIGNRTLRAEIPKGNFTFVVSKTDGKAVEQAELDSLFADKGPIEKIFYPDAVTCGIYNLHKNCTCVQMGTFGDYRDARKAFIRPHRSGISIVPMSHFGPSNYGPFLRGFAMMAPHESQMAEMLSVYVGNLPANCTAANLTVLFNTFGFVKKISLGHPVISDVHGRSRHAFVQFNHPRGVCQAIDHLHGREYRRKNLHVELRPQAKLAMQMPLAEARRAAAMYWDTYHTNPTALHIVYYLNRLNGHYSGEVHPEAGHTIRTVANFYGAWLAAGEWARSETVWAVPFYGSPAANMWHGLGPDFLVRAAPMQWPSY